MFDIESNEWIKFEFAGIYDGQNYTFCDSIQTLVKKLLNRRFKNFCIYAHNGGKFDFQFIIKELTAQNINFTLVTQGSRILEVKIKRGKNITRLRDSFALLPESLDQLCKSFQVTQKLTGSIDFENEKVDKANPKHVEYNRTDCVALFEVLSKYKSMPFISKSGVKLTRSSTALAAFRSTMKYELFSTPNQVQEFCRQAYAGGRTEIFKHFQKGGCCVDVNSLYPYCMTKPIPLELKRQSHDPKEFGFHEVTVKIPECYIPILWTKTPKLIFPTGIFKGTFFSEELKLALENGAEILEHHKGYHFTQSTDFFGDYIHSLYSARKQTEDLALKTVYKDLMNHVYGKFAEREEKKLTLRIDPKRPTSWPKKNFTKWRDEATFQKWGLITTEHRHRSTHMQVHIAAAVTAWGRIHMAQNFYLPFQEQITYTDTDSAFIESDHPISKELGACKKEYDLNFGFFMLPKSYFLEKTNGEIVRKIKGVRHKLLKSLTLNDFLNRNLNFKNHEFLSFRQSLIRKNDFLSYAETVKSIRGIYDKRKPQKDGATIPWHLFNGQLT